MEKELKKALRYSYEHDALFHSLIDMKAIGMVNAGVVLENLDPVIAQQVLLLLSSKESIEADITRHVVTPLSNDVSKELTRITRELFVLLGYMGGDY